MTCQHLVNDLSELVADPNGCQILLQRWAHTHRESYASIRRRFASSPFPGKHDLSADSELFIRSNIGKHHACIPDMLEP